ncbi:recombinase RecT [Sphingopyxis sp. 113P3]|uniref:recombinase RecT n=1 Tax=Sphingopyxis sp. (strain 113P3) TaxID=292913 RepID=UPI0009FA3B07|nr:recombinase RecT [Sphingopyxis sp. 113P3]
MQMNAQTQIATRADNPLAILKTQIDERAKEFQAALPSHISPEKFQRTILTAVQADPELLKASRKSLILACMKAANDGLLPDRREAALIVFKRNYKDAQGAWQQALEVQYLPMVFGLRKKILQSKEVTDIKPNVVYRREVEEGHFIYEEGTEAMLRHKPILDLTDEESSDDNIVVAYSIATYKDGTKSYEVMRRFEINKVQNCSQTGALIDKRGKPRTPSGPWVDWYPEQAKKTVMRRHSKTLPQSGDLVDVEGSEIDQQRAALSAMGALGAGEPIDATPVAPALPQADDLPDHDADTGEIIDTVTPDNPNAAEGRADEQHGDQHDGTEEPQGDEDQPYAATVSELIERAAAAGTVIDLNAVEKDWQKHMAALPDVENARIDTAVKERRDQLTAK